MVSCAAPEGVYTQRPVFPLEMSTLQGPELHLDVFTLCYFWTCLHYKGLCCTWTCLHHRGRSCTLTCLHCRGLPFFWSCLNYRGLSGIWTCLRYQSLCCTWMCLHHNGPELHLDLSTFQRAVQCAAPGGVYTTGPELSLDLSTLQWLVLVLDSIRRSAAAFPGTEHLP
jgi:hypothetical protein